MVIVKAERLRLKKLLSDAIPLLCRNGLSFETQFSIEALIGITLDKNEVVLVSFKETISADGRTLAEDDDRDNDDDECTTNESHREEQQPDLSQAVDKSQLHIDKTGPKLMASSHRSVDDRLAPNRTNVGLSPLQRKQTTSERRRKQPNAAYTPPPASNNVKSENLNDDDDKQFLSMISGTNFAAITSGSEVRNATGPFLQLQFKSESAGSFGDNEYDLDGGDCVVIKSEDESEEPADGFEIDAEMWQYGNDDGYNEAEYRPEQSFGHRPAKSKILATQATTRVERRMLYSRPVQLAAKRRRPSWPAVRRQSHALALPTSTSQGHNAQVLSVADSSDIPIGKPVYQCSFCTAIFNNPQSLRGHVDGVHFRKVTSQCPDCGQSFLWRAQLSRHRLRGKCPRADLDLNGPVDETDYA